MKSGTRFVPALVGLAAAVCVVPAHADGDFALLDTNHDGSLSRDEAAWQPVVSAEFDRMDVDKDGALSRPEFAAFEASAEREARATSDRAPAPATRRSSSAR